MKTIDLVIRDKEGLHARPAGVFNKAAKSFASKITMCKDGKTADMKKIFGMMGLAIKCGDTVTVTCEGSDEDAAIVELERIFHEMNI